MVRVHVLATLLLTDVVARRGWRPSSGTKGIHGAWRLHAVQTVTEDVARRA